jgi:hypothetical protein
MRAPQRNWVSSGTGGRGNSFVHLSDGSSFHPLQVVAPNTLPIRSTLARLSARVSAECQASTWLSGAIEKATAASPIVVVRFFP